MQAEQAGCELVHVGVHGTGVRRRVATSVCRRRTAVSKNDRPLSATGATMAFRPFPASTTRLRASASSLNGPQLQTCSASDRAWLRCSKRSPTASCHPTSTDCLRRVPAMDEERPAQEQALPNGIAQRELNPSFS